MADNEYNNFREFYCKKETRNGKGVVGRTNGSTEGLYLFFFLKTLLLLYSLVEMKIWYRTEKRNVRATEVFNHVVKKHVM